MKSYIKKRIVSEGLAFTILLAACSKKDVTTTPVKPTDPATTSTSYQLVDSIFLYAKQLYLWYDQLPDSSTFKPIQYSAVSGTDSAKGTAEIFALTRYAINPATGMSYEYYNDGGDTSQTKYSYLESHDADLNGGQGYKSYVTLLGWGNDLGFVPASGSQYANIIYPRIVYNGGPADLQNIKRGQMIYKINGTEVDLTTNAGIAAINAAFNNTTITLTFADSYTDGQKWNSAHTAYYRIASVTQSHDITLTQARYLSNPILKDTTLIVGTSKIGYLALLNFADPSVIATNLTNAFKTFSSNGITDIVVDLRYNGGGMVATSEQMADLIAPSSLNGKAMFTENYNQLVQNGKATILKQIPQDDNPSLSYYDYSWKASDLTSTFSASDGVGLSVKNVCFIVSSGTASASELLINNLKPYMNVKLIGTTMTETSNNLPAATTTYGKPVGFFAIPIGAYDVYLSEFESRNSANTAVPYSGFTCDVTDWDDATHDLGNIKEDGLAQAVSYITTGQFITTTSSIGAKSVVNNGSNSGVQIFMSTVGGANNGNVQSIKAYSPKIGFPVYKGMVETFKTIQRNR